MLLLQVNPQLFEGLLLLAYHSSAPLLQLLYHGLAVIGFLLKAPDGLLDFVTYTLVIG